MAGMARLVGVCREFSQRTCSFAVSRGGWMHYTWAVERSGYVRCIGAIYPVCNLRSDPSLEKTSRSYEIGLDQLENELDKHNPLERLTPLTMVAGVPMFYLYGDANELAPLRLSSEELTRRFRATDGRIDLVVKGKGHQLAPELWDNPLLPAFFLEHGLGSEPSDDAK